MNKIIIITLLLLANFSFSQNKFHDWEAAKNQSELSNKNILIILTGTAWSNPSMQLQQNVLNTNDFIQYATNNLVILEINLPNDQDYSSKVFQDYEYFENKYQTVTLPCIILVDSAGNEITKISSGLNSLENVLSQLQIYQ